MRSRVNYKYKYQLLRAMPKHPERSYYGWDSDEVQLLRQWADERYSAATIAYCLNRSIRAVYNKASKLGISLSDPRYKLPRKYKGI